MKLFNIFLLFLIVILNSCNSNVGKILRNEKLNTTDEFLVKKKDPLILPPDFEKIPTPGSLSEPSYTNEDEFREIIKKTKRNKTNKKNSSSVEESILKRIPK